MRRKQYAFVLLLLLFLVGGLWYFLKTEEPISLEQGNQESKPTELVFSGTSLVNQADGKKIWELTAKQILVNSETKDLILTDMKACFWQPDGSTLELHAPSGHYVEKTKEIKMSGPVNGKNAAGDSLTATELRYQADTGHLHGTGGITVKKEGMTLTADNMEADTALKTLKMSGNAQAKKGD